MHPHGKLLPGENGVLIGTTQAGGASCVETSQGCGLVFELKTK